MLEFKIATNIQDVITLRKNLEDMRNDLKKINVEAEPQKAEKLSKAIKDTSEQIRTMESNLSKLGYSLGKDIVGDFNRASAQTVYFKKKLAETDDEIDRLTSRLSKLSKGTREYRDAQKLLQGVQNTRARYSLGLNIGQTELADVKSRMSAFGANGSNIDILEKKFARLAVTGRSSVRSIEERIASMTKKSQTAGEVMQGIAMRLQRLQYLSFAGIGAGSFISKIVGTRGEFQDIEASFRVLLGDADKAVQLFDQMKTTAATTPFSLQEVSGGAKQLLAYGVAANDVNNTLIKLGDIAAALNIPLSQLNYLYGTTISQGRLYTRDIMQFQSRGIPLLDTLSTQLGKTKNEISAMVTAGKIGNKEFIAAIDGMAGAGGKFHGMMEERSKTINGQISNIEDNISQLFNKMGESSEGAINTMIGSAGNGVEFVKDHLEELGKALMEIIAIWGTFKAASVVEDAISKAQAKFIDNKTRQLTQANISDTESSINSVRSALGMKEQSVTNTDGMDTAKMQEVLALRQKELQILEAERAQRIAFAEADKAGYDDIIKAHTRLEESQKRVDDLWAQGKSGTEEYKSAQIELAEAENALADAKKKILEPYDAAVEAAQAQVDTWESEFQAAVEFKDAEAAQTAQMELNTAQTNLNAATKQRDAMAENVNTAATAKNTTQQQINTLQTGANTTATTANTIGTKIATTAKLMWANACRQVTTALNGMKAALISNPITAIATAAMTAVSVFMMLADSEDEVAESTEKWGEATSKTLSSLEINYTLLSTSAKSSQTYKTALDNLVTTAKEYGITIDENKDKMEQINDVREKLIALIKEEGIERQYANQLQSSSDRYESELQDISKDIADRFRGIDDDMRQTYADIIITNLRAKIPEIKAIAEEMNRIYATSGYSEEYFNNLKKYNALIDSCSKAVKEAAKNNGENEESVASLGNATHDYTNKVLKSYTAMNMRNDAINRAHDANIATEASTKGLSDEMKNNAYRAQLLKGNVSQLKDELQRLAIIAQGKYHMKINIDVDTSNMPKWMKDKYGFNSKTNNYSEKGRENAQFDAANFEAMFRQLNKSGKKSIYSKQYGKTFTIQELAERAAYATAVANTKKEETTPSKTGNKDKGNKEANERKNAAKKLAEDLKKLEQDNQNAQTALMEDGREKRLQIIENEYNKRIAEIKKQQKEFEENNKKAGKSALLTSEQRNAIDKATKLAQQQRKKQIDEINKEEITAMRDYLRQYGTFQEQKLAIAKEYAEKIAKAQTEGEKRTLEKERDKALDEVTNRQTQEAEGMKNKIDWADVFNDLGVRSTRVLQNIKKQLQDILRTNHDLAIDDIKDISEKISQIDSELGNRNNWFYSPTLERYKEAKAESARAGEAFQSARRDSISANADVNRNKQAIAELLRSMGIKADARAIDSHDLGKYIKDLDPKKAEELNNAFDKLAKSEAKAEKAGEKEAKMGQEAAKAKEKEANAHLDFSQKMAAASEALNSFGNKLADLPELLNQLGLGKASEKVGYGLNAINDASGAMADYAKGNYIGTAAKTISAVKNVGRVFGIGEGNGKEVAEKTERLTKSNERLTKAVDGLKDEMSKQGGAKSIKTADEALKDQKQINAQTMEILKTQMSYSHSHHSNAHYFNLGAKGYASVNETLAQYAKNNPLAESVVSSVSSLADIYKLTPEQMDYIRKHNVEMWESMLAQGKYDKSEYWEAYADLAGATDEITNALKASITQTTYDSFRDGFKSSLLDMDKDATSFADGFSEKLMQSVLNARISDVLDDDLQKFYNDWFEAGKSDAMLTASEIASLRERYDELVERGLKLRDEAAKITGYDKTYESSQKSTTGYGITVNQESVDEVNGRFTALQIAGENINTNTGLLNVNAQQLISIGSEARDIASDCRDIMASSYIELQQISENTNAIIKPMRQVASDVAEMKKYIKDL